MELKEFIEKTIGSIIESTAGLQVDHVETGALINPPVSSSSDMTFCEGDVDHVNRRIELIEFDLAVTVSSEKGGGGSAGIKILGANLGAEGKANFRSEEVSRVRFSIPIALSPCASEAVNRQAKVERDAKISRSVNAPRNSNPYV